MKLFQTFSNIIKLSSLKFSKPDYNKLYCSQWVEWSWMQQNELLVDYIMSSHFDNTNVYFRKNELSSNMWLVMQITARLIAF